MESSGVQWSPLESSGVQWSPLESIWTVGGREKYCFLLPSVSVANHAAAGDLAFNESSKNLTFSVSDSPVFINMILSSRFMKSWGSWSSGFPVNSQFVISDISMLSSWWGRMTVGGIGEVCWFSCGVQVAGENVNWVDGVDNSVETDDSSSEVSVGEALHVEGTKRFSSSLSLKAMGWRAVSLDQSTSSFN